MTVQPVAMWNKERDVWEVPQLDLFGQSAVFLGTFPKSGTMRNGQFYARPTLVDVITEPEFSSLLTLPTPMSQHSGNTPQEHLRKKPGRKRVTDLSILVENNLLETGGELPATEEEAPEEKERLFPTPKASDGVMGRPKTTGRPIEMSGHLCTIATLLPGAQEEGNTPDSEAPTVESAGDENPHAPLLPTVTTRDCATPTGEEKRNTPALRAVHVYFPTPNTMDSLPAREGEARERQLRRGDMNAKPRSSTGNLREDIMEIAQHSLPTPNARDGGGGGAQHPDHRKKGNHQVCLTDAATVMGENSEAPTSMFGRYTDAVRRWEDTINRPAPSPTELNTKNKPRLTAPFAEWMMGLPAGWVTSEEIGLTRTQQLQAIGNGVVPQQAATALAFLLDRAAQSQ